MSTVRGLVITGYGTNCERESAHALTCAGADTVAIAHFADLAGGRVQLADYNYLIFPGGFLDGDDLGSAQAAALRYKHARTADGHPLVDQLREFIEAGSVILGICNGFQLLVKLGLLPAIGGAYFTRQASLSHNDSARFEDRWVWLRTDPNTHCVFTRGIDRIHLPVRHGEGKVVFADDDAFVAAQAGGHIALAYTDGPGGDVTLDYPANPNGSPRGIAGLTDTSGRILGLMPHPEAFNHITNHPYWTRLTNDERNATTLGTALLEGGVRYLREA